jgi:hypothetical protein
MVLCCKRVVIGVVMLAVIGWFADSVLAVAGQKVGTIADLKGLVEILHPGVEAFRAAKPYEEVMEKDRIRTGPGAQVKILYDDDSLTILSENSSFEIQEYQLNDQGERSRSLLGLIKGKLRFIVTRYLVKRKANFYVQTPTAVVGVMGSDSVAVLDDTTSTTTAYHLSGELEVTNRMTDQISFISSGEFITIFPDGRQEQGKITTEQMEKILGFFGGTFPPPEAVKDQIRRVEQELRQEDIETILHAPERKAQELEKKEEPNGSGR